MINGKLYIYIIGRKLVYFRVSLGLAGFFSILKNHLLRN